MFRLFRTIIDSLYYKSLKSISAFATCIFCKCVPCLFAGPQWPRGLRRRSAAARLLRSWVRIPPGHGWMSVVSVACCQVEVSATSWSLVQRSPTECDASLCVISKPQEWGGHGPHWAAAPQKENLVCISTVQISHYQFEQLIVRSINSLF